MLTWAKDKRGGAAAAVASIICIASASAVAKTLILGDLSSSIANDCLEIPDREEAEDRVLALVSEIETRCNFGLAESLCKKKSDLMSNNNSFYNVPLWRNHKQL